MSTIPKTGSRFGFKVDTMTNYTDDTAVIYRWRDEMADLIEEEK